MQAEEPAVRGPTVPARCRPLGLLRTATRMTKDGAMHFAFAPVFVYFALGLVGLIVLARLLLGWAQDSS